jgi:hypothetical protein
MKYFFLFLTLITVNAEATTKVDDAVIQQVSISKPYGNYAFIRLLNKPVSTLGCANNGYWHFTLPLVSEIDKVMYSSLLAAYMSKTSVSLSGFETVSCNEFDTIESLSGFVLN